MNTAHNPCVFQSKDAQQPCGHESTRIATNGQRYCEYHYNRLPNNLKPKPVKQTAL